MKKYLLILSVIVIAFSSCSKSADFDPQKQAVADDSTIRAYLIANPSIKATKDPSGVYYQVIKEGAGANPTINSTVKVNYKGTLLNGTQFDANNGFESPLSGLIDGWKVGIPLIKPGGSILLIIPSGLGYGNNQAGSIPANSVLIFRIDLLSFN